MIFYSIFFVITSIRLYSNVECSYLTYWSQI